jgi:hypothetical protein
VGALTNINVSSTERRNAAAWLTEFSSTILVVAARWSTAAFLECSLWSKADINVRFSPESDICQRERHVC